MRMNVQPIPNVPDRVNEIRSLTAQIVNKEILPQENMLWAWLWTAVSRRRMYSRPVNCAKRSRGR